MTLREGLIELTEQLREQGKMVVLLDAMLAQTAAADAEQSRLARIGALTEELVTKTEFLWIGGPDYFSAGIELDNDCCPVQPYVEGNKLRTLLDALEALKERCG